MDKLILPVPSHVPLDVLRKSIAELTAKAPLNSRWWDRNTASRLRNRCSVYGVDQLWMIATLERIALEKSRSMGPKTANLAEEILQANGCTFDMFPSLRETIEAIVTEFRETLNPSCLSCFEILMTIAGTGAWADDPILIAVLAKQGLCPNMTVEELFVYAPSKTDA